MSNEKGTPRTDAFREKTNVSPSGCWLWAGATSRNGYGQVWNGKKVVLAHRHSYELFVGHIPNKMFVCHHCDNPPCVNPEHLFVGTASDNLIDCLKKGRRPKTGPTRGNCKNAHLTAEQATEVKRAIATRPGSLKDLSKKMNISLHVIKGISRGTTY